MSKSLIFLIVVVIFLCWKFVFTSSSVEYTDPAKVLQGISMAIPYKGVVARHWKEKGELPTSEDWDNSIDKPMVDLSRSLADSIVLGEMGPGVISIYFKNKPGIEMEQDVTGKRVLLLPVIENDKLSWICEGTVPAELMPKKCIHRSEE